MENGWQVVKCWNRLKDRIHIESKIALFLKHCSQWGFDDDDEDDDDEDDGNDDDGDPLP